MPSSKIRLFSALNLILLISVSTWLWLKNQPVDLVSPELAEGGKLQCASYAPYYGKGQSPFIKNTQISREQIEGDLKLLSERFECIRTYSVSQGLDYVPEAAGKLGLEVLLGVWIGWTEAENNKELTLGIKLANQYPEVIRGLIVGNEVLLRKEQTPAKMLAYIKRANDATDVPVTYADVWEFWLKNKSLENAVDYVTVHVLPYWEDDPQAIDDAIPHAATVMDELAGTFSKPLFIGETGWPSIGRHRNASAPSQLNQASYIRGFVQAASEKGWNYNLIEAIDQPWKRILEGSVGGHWGLYDSQLAPKFALSGPVAERNDGWHPLIWSLGAILLFSAIMRFGNDMNHLAGYCLIAPLAALSGMVAYLQFGYLVTACRDIWEWLGLGGVAVAGWIGVILIPGLIAGKRHAPKFIQASLWGLSITTLICGALVVFDGRYRDFPLSLYMLPAVQFGLVLGAAGLSIGAMSRNYRAIALLAAIYAALALWPEPLNQHALLWLGLTLLLLSAGFHKNNTLTSNT
ncbi:hypothetical protein MTYP_00970 [Methylophilaceae bacterium]|nr:hypothetical protein MTYP_00970 [Methylophilaceae bacterium]